MASPKCHRTPDMLKLYRTNSLVHWDEREIDARERMERFFAAETRRFLKAGNPAWEIERVEAPPMVPRSMVNANYGDDDLWAFSSRDEGDEELVARPETTAGTYAWMVHRLQSQSGVRLPWAVWQSGHSFRRERDQVLGHMRLKCFRQMEFQCAFSADTMNDYQEACLEPVRRMVAAMTGLETRIVESDRLPSYSRRTVDIEAMTGEGYWMELCSISLRTDFPVRFSYVNKKKEKVETDVLVLEIALGLDRCVHAWTRGAGRTMAGE